MSPHVENGELQVAVVSDRTSEFHANLRVRVMTFKWKVLSVKVTKILVPKLSSGVFQAVAIKSLPSTASQLAQVFVTANLNEMVSLCPIELSVAHLSSSIDASKPGNYVLHNSSDVLARSVWVHIPSVDAELSETLFDILLGKK
ncbi:MAG: hypothetical protein M3Y72_01885 [Acidobacteriota bacterium]|nr:hypothetical protein [Acidobacteriota bacterium]